MTVVLPVTPAKVAPIRDEPGVEAVTRPLPLMGATPESAEAHVTLPGLSWSASGNLGRARRSAGRGDAAAIEGRGGVWSPAAARFARLSTMKRGEGRDDRTVLIRPWLFCSGVAFDGGSRR